MNIVDFFNKENKTTVVKEQIVVESATERSVRIGRYASHRNTFEKRFLENVISEFVGNIVYRATPLEEEFKSQFKDAIFKRTAEIVKEQVNMDWAIYKPSTAIQAAIIAFGENMAKTILKETTPGDRIPKDEELDRMDKAELDKEDKLEVEDLANRLHGDDVAEIINTKTIEVINDEAERAAKRQEDIEAIKTETGAEEPDTTDVEPGEEIEESLFGALSRHNSMKSITESADGKIAETALAEAIMEYVVYETLNTLRYVEIDDVKANEIIGKLK